jgi:SAM-dependent methyltransferase
VDRDGPEGWDMATELLVDDELTRTYEEAFAADLAGGPKIYGDPSDWPAVTAAAHERRMELLDALPVGDLTGKVCVDYGCGPWGFACVYPRLHHCGQAIGIDISRLAVQASEALSASGKFPYGRNYRYLTSKGERIDLATGSIDLFFGGESIEHVENTDAFLDEIHRVLKPGGQCVLTTPNADAYVYRIQGEVYTIGPEHVALMSYHELVSYLRPRFEIILAKGFNGSLYHPWDDRVRDAAFAAEWARMFEDRPELATGLVILARRRDDYDSAGYRQERHTHRSPSVRYTGDWSEMTLHGALTARMTHGHSGAALEVGFTGTDLLVHLWCHDWSGVVEVDVDGETRLENLYSPRGGFRRVHVRGLAAGRQHVLRIRGAGVDPRSHSDQILFHQAIAYGRAA